MGWKPAFGALAAAAAVGLMPAGGANADALPHQSPFTDDDCGCAGLMFAPPNVQKTPAGTPIPLLVPEISATGSQTSKTLPISMTHIYASDGAGTIEMVDSANPTDGASLGSPQQRIDDMQRLGGVTGEVGTFLGFPSVTSFGQGKRSDGLPGPYSKVVDIWADGRVITVRVIGDSADDVTANFDALATSLQIR